ncbi:MAG: CopG family transcriptional regulator [Nocardioidaceae bacterium]|nr:CopG family transcriptional regulator [Nocardioidaceae bacterium]
MMLRIDERLEAALTALADAEGVSREAVQHRARVQDSTGRMRERWAAVLKRLGGA